MTIHQPGLTENEFIAWGDRVPDVQLEYTATGELLFIPGTCMATGARICDVGGQLANWARADGRGRTYASSTSFLLPNGARRSPDASWIHSDRRRAAHQPGVRFPVLAPDFVVELKSSSDRLKKVREKMEEWIENGVQLGWLIDPETRSVTIYRPGQSPETIMNLRRVEGEGPIAGFVLDLERVWEID